MIVTLSIFHNPATEFSGEFYSGESEQIVIRTNCAEIQNMPVEFLGETRQAVIEQVIAYLRGMGLSGRLKIV